MGSANALVTRAGELLLYHNNGTTNRLLRGNASGDPPTFGPAEVLTRLTTVLSPGPGRAIELSASHPIAPGRIVSEGYYALPPCNGSQSRMVCNQSAVQVYFSDDNGQTHRVSSTLLPGMDESQLVELASGELVLFSRNSLRCTAPGKTYDAHGMCVAQTRSTDAGDTGRGRHCHSAQTPILIKS